MKPNPALATRPTLPTFHRWLRFNVVGALGMGVQLSSLALLNRAAPGHYLLASGAAVELTILHNFLWHIHYTWSDRRETLGAFPQLVRFQLSNGLVSLLGNLVLMRLLVEWAHLPIVAANVMAIVACSLVNFALSNCWTFVEATRSGARS